MKSNSYVTKLGLFRPCKLLAGAIILAGVASSQAQLTVYTGPNQTGSGKWLAANRVYWQWDLGSFNDSIESFMLPKGYGVVFGVNWNNVGPGKCIEAIDGDRYMNLSGGLKDSISWIRVFPIKVPVTKKGSAGSISSGWPSALNVSWSYNWGANESSTSSIEYTPMSWGAYPSSAPAFATSMQTKSVGHLLTFNEPDNKTQANATITNALDSYEALLQSGLRMGSPVCTQGGYRNPDPDHGAPNGWLVDFMTEAKKRGYRVDFLAAHWYGYSVGAGATSTQLVNSMGATMLDLQAKCGYGNMGVWLTEYNVAGNTTDLSKEVSFINASTTWFNNTSWLERHAFYHWNLAGSSPTTLNNVGAAYSAAPSVQSRYVGGNAPNNFGY